MPFATPTARPASLCQCTMQPSVPVPVQCIILQRGQGSRLLELTVLGGGKNRADLYCRAIEADDGRQVAAEIGIHLGFHIKVLEADLHAGTPKANPASTPLPQGTAKMSWRPQRSRQDVRYRKGPDSLPMLFLNTM